MIPVGNQWQPSWKGGSLVPPWPRRPSTLPIPVLGTCWPLSMSLGDVASRGTKRGWLLEREAEREAGRGWDVKSARQS